MLSFYTIVIMIAIVIFILALVLIGMTLNSKNSTVPFPEYQTLCPDFWTLNAEKKCIPSVLNTPAPGKFYTIHDISHNGIVLEKNPNRIVSLDPSENSWTSLCDKSKWANKNAILWDGIANTNQC